MKKALLTGLVLGVFIAPVGAMSTLYTNQVVSGQVASSNTYTLDLSKNNIDYLSMQVVYSSASPATAIFTDGNKSTGTITVKSTSTLLGANCTASMTMTSTSTLYSADIVVNGNHYLMGSQWSLGASTGATLLNIVNAVNSPPYGITAATTSAGATLTTTASGTFCNNFVDTVTINGAIAVTGSSITITNFSGGLDPAFLNINGQVLLVNRDWFVTGSSVAVSTSIVAAINANSVLSQIMVATTATSGANLGVVFATATSLGINNYSMYSSSQTLLATSSNTFLNGSASAVNVSQNLISIPNHGYGTGLQVLLATPTVGTLPVPLIGGTTYFAVAPLLQGSVIPDPNNVQLSTSATAATAGIVTKLTSQTANGGGTFTLTPLAFSGSETFTYQLSNDGVNFTNVASPAPGTVTINTSTLLNTTTYYDFGNINARYFRVNVVGPSAGAGVITATANGKGSR